MSARSLVANQGSPMLGLSGGQAGSFANATQSIGSSLSSMFAPGSNSAGPPAPFLNPFEGQLHSRFEMNDTIENETAKLSDMVVFMMMSDGEDFYTRSICPIIEWDWAIKRINYGTWVFPQYAVLPTPETAPPRYVESYEFNDTTSLTRYATGHHMSVEYMNTEKGKRNQLYNLKQLSLNIQETMNLCVINALMNCRKRVAERREAMGSYNARDLEEEFKNEVSRFCRVQKEEYGFLTMWEEILREMARLGGKADSVIITKRINTLVVTRPEYTKYMEAGPSGPATVSNPNRTFLPTGVQAYFSNTYPERSGSSQGPWQQLIQIGTYVQSRELSILTSKSDEYFKHYDSKTRSVWIYDVNVDKFVEVDVKKMIENCGLFENNGALRLPSVGRNFAASAAANGGGLIRDFLTMDDRDIYSDDYWKQNPYQGLQLSESSAPEFGGGSSSSGMSISEMSTFDRVATTMGKSRAAIARIRSDGVRPISLIGHLREEHFGVSNFQDCGHMILHRIADINGCSAQKLITSIQQGLVLFADMSRRQIDFDFVDYVVRNAVITMYKTERGAVPDLAIPSSHVKGLYVDGNAKSHDDIWKCIQDTCLQSPNIKGLKAGKNDAKLRVLKNIFEHNLCLPLPTWDDVNDNFNDASFPNLTGYQSFPGFCEMAKVFKSGSQIPRLVKRYNMKELEIASNFVDALEMFAQGLESILPECLLFSSERDGSLSQNTSVTKKAWVIAEKVFNMGGLNVWCNLKKHSLFLIDEGTKKLWTKGAEDYIGPAADLNAFLAPATSPNLGEFYQEVTHKAVASYYGQLLDDVMLGVKKFTDQFVEKDWDTLTTDFFKSNASARMFLGNSASLTKENLLKLVRSWIFPKLFNKKKGVHDNTSGLAVVDPSTIADRTTNGNATTQTLVGMFAGVSTNASQLCCGNAWMGENCILLSGPLRLEVFEGALKAVLHGLNYFGAGNANKFLEIIFDINNMMAPYDHTVLDKLKDIKGYATAKDTFATYDELFNADRENYLISLKSTFPELDWVTKVGANTLSKQGLGMEIYKELLVLLYNKYFGSATRMAKPIEQLKKKLDKAVVDDKEHEKKLKVGDVPFPILRNYSSGDGDVKFPMSDVTAAKLLEEVFVNQLASLLGVKCDYASKDKGDADDFLIGAKSKKSTKQNERLRQQKVLNFYTDEKKALTHDKESLNSFFKTSLVFSAEQMEHLLSTNMTLSVGTAAEHLKHIDLRPTNPGDYSKFVSRQKCKELRQLIERANSEEASGAYGENPESQPSWRKVPLLHVSRKLKYTIFGAPLGMGWHYSGGCGLPVDVLNKSFARTCFALDRNKCPAAVKMLALCYMCTLVTMNTMLALSASNVRVFMNFILARPHRNLLTESCAILSTGINNLGFTAMACRDYITGQTVLTKEWAGHVSFMTNAIITHPENCYIQPNIMVTNYGTGQGVRFFSNPDDYGVGEKCGSNIPDPNFPSMFCFAVPFTEVVDRNYICTPGKVPHLAEATQSTQIKATEALRRENHYSTAPRYNERWNFNTMLDSRLMATMGCKISNPLYNTQCYQDTCKYWDPYHKEIRYMSLGTGHLGHNQGPGFKAVMEGKVVRFKDYGYETNPSITIV